MRRSSHRGAAGSPASGNNPHARVWSSTIRFETTEGRVWFKVSGSGTAYEAALIALLGELRPSLAPDVIAHDDNRRWSLTLVRPHAHQVD